MVRLGRGVQRIDDGDLDPKGISLKDNPSASCLLPSAFQGGSLVNFYLYYERMGLLTFLNPLFT